MEAAAADLEADRLTVRCRADFCWSVGQTPGCSGAGWHPCLTAAWVRGEGLAVRMNGSWKAAEAAAA